ncbi:MAG: SRPBCC family protein [Proteobacteria bacterium]|nr:SRPBCC family protein [Pseudomonadota bacterium]
MGEFEEQIIVSASPDKVWDVLADIRNIYLWNPGVVRSRLTTHGEVRVGARRLCNLGGKNYLDEEVIEFEKPHRLTMRINDTNLPFKAAEIRFTVEPQGGKTLVRVSPKYQLKFGLLGSILDTIMVRSQYRKGMQELLRGLRNYVEQSVAN